MKTADFSLLDSTLIGLEVQIRFVFLFNTNSFFSKLESVLLEFQQTSRGSSCVLTGIFFLKKRYLYKFYKKIFNFLGRRSSGKSSVLNYVLKKNNFNSKDIVIIDGDEYSTFVPSTKILQDKELSNITEKVL